MSELLLDLRTEQNWELVHNDTVIAGRRGPDIYIPIRPFVLPVLFTSPILMVSAENIDARPWWYLGCRMQQLVETGVVPGEVIGRFARVPVNRPILLRFPRLAGQFSLKVEIPPWYDRMKIAVWEYVGPINDSTESLISDSTDLIRVDLARIESKLE